MLFQVPNTLSAEANRELNRAWVAGGADNMPWPTDVHFENGKLAVRRSVDESGSLQVGWEIDSSGWLMGATATLMERPEAYFLPLELARGKVNQLRGQEADWRAGGLQVPEPLAEKIHQCSLYFGKAATSSSPEDATSFAQKALALASQSADDLVRTYTDQVFQIRHQRQPRLDAHFGCRLTRPIPDGPPSLALSTTFNSVSIAPSWSEIEPESGMRHWELIDELLQWAEKNNLGVTLGPLIDFAASRLPPWLWLYERDLASLAGFLGSYIEAAVNRYKGRVKSWQLTSASNSAALLSLGEDELMWLTVRLAEIARQVDPTLDLIVGIAQPWGEYMALEDRTHSPFMFADNLVRSGLNLGSLDIEVVMGVTPRGSYCRDTLEMSRLVDLYSLLGVPLRVTAGYPCHKSHDPLADPEMRLGAGRWRGGFNPEVQNAWAEAYVSLILCKPSVQAIHWVHDNDGKPHLFPQCGLIAADGTARPVLHTLRRLREAHLR